MLDPPSRATQGFQYLLRRLRRRSERLNIHQKCLTSCIYMRAKSVVWAYEVGVLAAATGELREAQGQNTPAGFWPSDRL